MNLSKLVYTEKAYLNADKRKSNADTRRFYRRDNLRPSACNLRESALNRGFSAVTKLKFFPTVSIFFLFCFILQARADVVYLKNDRSLEGFVSREDGDKIELDVGFGTVMFPKTDIKDIYKSTSQEAAALRKKWRDGRIKLEKVKLEEKKKPKSVEVKQNQGHIIVDTVLNRTGRAQLLLDTGASLVVISQKIAGDSGLDLEKETRSIKLRVADGREVNAKFVILKNVSVQGVEAENVEAAVIPDDAAQTGIKDGVLGMSFLRRFNFKVDNNSGSLILERL